MHLCDTSSVVWKRDCTNLLKHLIQFAFGHGDRFATMPATGGQSQPCANGQMAIGRGVLVMMFCVSNGSLCIGLDGHVLDGVDVQCTHWS